MDDLSSVALCPAPVVALEELLPHTNAPHKTERPTPHHTLRVKDDIFEMLGKVEMLEEASPSHEGGMTRGEA